MRGGGWGLPLGLRLWAGALGPALGCGGGKRKQWAAVGTWWGPLWGAAAGGGAAPGPPLLQPPGPFPVHVFGVWAPSEPVPSPVSLALPQFPHLQNGVSEAEFP